jgi:hypothetical protein
MSTAFHCGEREKYDYILTLDMALAFNILCSYYMDNNLPMAVITTRHKTTNNK